MSDYNDIVDANGEIIHVSADDSADGIRLTQDGQQLILVDEDAIAQFTTKASTTLTDLGTARAVLTHGDANPPQIGVWSPACVAAGVEIGRLCPWCGGLPAET